MAFAECLENRILLAGEVEYRLNAGGSELSGTPVWAEDTKADPSPFHTSGSNVSSSSQAIDVSHGSIPAGAPEALFQTERWDPSGGTPLEWDFPVAPGDYEVRLYFAETWTGAHAVGARTFDVSIEGVSVLDDYDVFATVGPWAGVVESFVVSSDSNLDIDFAHVVQNPSIKGIEILSIVANEPPVALANTVSTIEDNAYQFEAGDFPFTDAEGDALSSATISNLSLAGGTLQHSGGTPVNNGDTLTPAQLDTLVYTPPANVSGSPLATFDFTVNDADPGVVSAQMNIDVTPPEVAYRVNAGGSALSETPVWAEDTQANPSPYHTAGSSAFGSNHAVDLSDSSIPEGTPEALFQTERYSTSSNSMSWDFPVTAGDYEVRLYFAENWTGAHSVGARTFDVSIEGVQVLDDYDVFAAVGAWAGVVESFVVSSDSNLDIDFAHVVQNPAIKGIEILNLGAPSAPPSTLAAASETMNFPTIPVSTTAEQSLQLTHSGSAGDPPITIVGTNLSGSGAGEFSDSLNDAESVTLAPGESYILSVTYHPTAVGAAVAQLAVNHDGANSPLMVALSGNAMAQNEPPVALANTVSTIEDRAYLFAVSDFSFSDAEGDALASVTISNLSLGGGTLQHSGGTTINNSDTLSAAQLDTLVYTPPANVSGSPLATFDFTVNDADPGVVLAQMNIDVTPPEVTYRVNAGGSELSGTPVWAEDTKADPSPFHTSGSNVSSSSHAIDLSHSSIPEGTPEALFQTERWDPSSGNPLEWDFPVTPGDYEVRLYFAETWTGAHTVGARTFDVSIEGGQVLDDYDVFATVGAWTGVVESFVVSSDSNLDIDFAHVVENPAIKGVEILNLGAPSTPPSTLSPSSEAVSFPTIPVGATSGQTLQLTHSGSAGDPHITIAGTSLSGSGAGEFGDAFNDAEPVTLAPGESYFLSVTHQPTAAGAALAQLAITHDGANSPLMIALSGHATTSTGAQATVIIDSGNSINSSTYASGSFVIENHSNGGEKITSVTLDLSTSILPDLVFDPNGGAGDLVSKDFTVDANTGVGSISHSYLGPHDDGFDAVQVDFGSFAVGDSFSFSLDVDPTSIRGVTAPGPHHSGSVSGLELTGATVTIEFDDGTTLIGQTFHVTGHLGASEVVLQPVLPAAPTLEVLNVGATPAVVSDAAQTIRVGGPVGADVSLMVLEGGLFTAGVPGGGFDLDPFEANTALAVTDIGVTIGASGFVDIPITLTSSEAEGGLNHIVATLLDAEGRSGPLSTRAVLQLNTTATGNQPPTAIAHTVSTTKDNALQFEAGDFPFSDPESDPLSSVTITNQSLAGGTLEHSGGTTVDNGDTLTPAQLNSLVYTPPADASGAPLATFEFTVNDADPGVVSAQMDIDVTTVSSSLVAYRENVGGGQLSGTPVWAKDTTKNPSPFHTSGSKVSSSGHAVDLSHGSIPEGTPEALFKSDRWDPSSGNPLSWDFPITPGDYEVRLYFAENWTGAHAVGARTFDVFIEGVNVLDDYDVFATVGAWAGVVESFVVSSDSNLDIDFAHVIENPAVKGVEILYLDAADVQPTHLTPARETVSFTSIPVGETADRTVVLTHTGTAWSGDITITGTSLSGSGAGEFSHSFDAAVPLTLAPGESVVLTVTYTPTSTDSAVAELTITHDGENDPLVFSIDTLALPVGFGKSALSGESSVKPTSLQFGPDGRLYVAQQNGLIRIYDVVRNGANDYTVAATETITSIKALPNHDDDGTPNSSITSRLVTGLLVVGTAENPVIFVGSSDPRIGAGPSGTDLNLDTNSGVISRLTWNGSSWDQLELVRGLPRSEENHANNGLQYDAATNTLYVAHGGNTNMGATSNNFALQPEYALSAAILSIDLDAIGETTYDLPTLNDEDRPGSSDLHDPFGGNNGKNQAILVPGGPVQVYAPGFRNAYDIVLTPDGRMYAIDNGPNSGWGDVPIGEGPEGNATNDVNEPGQTYGDSLHFITGEGYYGGHPNPTRSNPDNTFNETNPQSPVSVGNPIESDYRIPGVENGALVVFPASTNGLVMYTATNFGAVMQGNLLAASFDNSVKRIELNYAGDTLISHENLFNSVGIVPLDVTALGDTGPFPGTIWVADIVDGSIYVFEPNDFDGGSGGSGNPDDLDGDGYSNADEEANGTNPNSAADVPPDWDQDFVSNLLDPDDDDDSLLDTEDPFAIDPANGQDTPIGTLYTWENDAPDPGGLLGLGFTGLMTNGAANYEDLFDITELTAGGAAGVLTVDGASEGTARGGSNTQEQAFQFGFDVSTATEPFTGRTRVAGPFAGLTPQAGQEVGFYLGTGDQDNYVQVALTGNNGGSIEFLAEIEGQVEMLVQIGLTLPGPDLVDLFLTVDPLASTVQASYVVFTSGVPGPRETIGTPFSIPSAWLAESMAIGVISTSDGPAPPFPATWDYLGVVLESTLTGPEAPPLQSSPLQSGGGPPVVAGQQAPSAALADNSQDDESDSADLAGLWGMDHLGGGSGNVMVDASGDGTADDGDDDASYSETAADDTIPAGNDDGLLDDGLLDS